MSAYLEADGSYVSDGADYGAAAIREREAMQESNMARLRGNAPIFFDGQKHGRG